MLLLRRVEDVLGQGGFAAPRLSADKNERRAVAVLPGSVAFLVPEPLASTWMCFFNSIPAGTPVLVSQCQKTGCVV